mmetsp:Transcript_123817/g.361512  ORF Transcript_123817/g.361512 Transcript_123817/m.361512 type:complete len:1048 (+) Transcript_123817:69-3212(+)
MQSDELRKRQFPYCTVLLILGAFACNLCVLIGNLRTASAMNELGYSSKGWSRVGLGIAKSLEDELDYKMHEVSSQLLQSLGHISFVQDAMEVVISIVGNETDGAVENATALLQQRNPQALAMLQRAGGDPLQALVPVISGSVHQVMEGLQAKVAQLLHELLELLKPALKQVEDWLHKFGETIQNSIEAFSVTLDRVQKIFDQLMQQLNGHGDNVEELLNETIQLFNVDNSGDISVDDLQLVAELYSITALKGEKAEELMKKYDDSGDMELQYDEMQELVQDESVPDLMPVVLRIFARRMSEVAGNVKAARMRDEVALAVSQYLALVCAKNMTRASWVADALGNGSVPIAFTTDLFVQMCLNNDDPNNQMTSVDIGKIMTQLMYELHPGYTLETLDLMSNTTFWASEGFRAKDQPKCLRLFTEWITDANMSTTQPPSSFRAAAERGVDNTGSDKTVVEMLAAHGHPSSDQEVLLAMPATAQRLAEEGVALHLLEEHRARQQERERRFSSRSSQVLITHLFGGVPPTDRNKKSSTQKAVSSGQKARPETLQFATWLANNASSRADDYQHECFEYSSQSSSALDSFATQIKGMVSKVEGFLNVMMKYSTPAAIDRLEQQVEDFTSNAVGDVLKVVEEKVVKQLNQSIPLVEGAVKHAAHEAGEKLGHMIGDILGTPMGHALKEPIQEVIGKMADDSAASQRIGEKLGEGLAVAISNLSASILGDQVGDAMEGLVVAGLKAAGDGASSKLHLGLLQERSGGIPVLVSGVWEKMAELLKKLVNMLPSATDTLKFARKEVSKLYSNLNSIFRIFENKGAQIFDSISSLWRMLWTIYFLFLVSLYPFILFYALWCRGWFSGPQPLTAEEEEAYQKPQTFRESCAACRRSCSMCMKLCHDTSLCLWSLVMLVQVIALVVFVISIALCILAGVKVFITAGCAQIYVINDETICKEALVSIRDFLSTFVVSSALTPLEDSCVSNDLLACELISRKMATSSALTTVFSLLSAVLTLQLTFDSAISHEQARWRRIVTKKMLDEEAEALADVAQASGSAP